MEVNVANKIERLFDKLLEGKCQVKDDTLDKLLTHFREREDSILLTTWIKKAVVMWSATGVTPAPDVIIFALNVAALLSKNEDRFSDLNNNNFFIKLVNVTKARQNTVAPSIKSAYVKLLSSFLEHTSGIEWMIACSFWEDVYHLSLTTQNEESIRFVSKLLEKTISCDENFCDNVAKRMMSPLGENIYKSIKDSDGGGEMASGYLKPTLELIGNVLEHFLEGVLFGGSQFDVLIVFLKNFHLEERISDFMVIAQSKCLALHIAKIMFIMQFLELYVKVVTNTLTGANINATIDRIKINYISNMCKESYKDIVELCRFGQIYWKLMDSKIPTKSPDSPAFSNQLMIILIVPHFCVLIKHCYDKGDWEAALDDAYRDVYIQKLFKMTCHDIVRVCYSWRDAVLVLPDVFKLCNECSDTIKQSQKYLNKDSAVVVVQGLIWVLYDVVRFVKESAQKLESFINELDYFLQVFEILAVFIEEFHITWQESLEAIDILTSCFDFLMLHRWPSQVVVKALNLMNIAIAKYMAPNLALLLDRTTDSTTALLGPLLYAKMYDVSAVKTAALEVVRTMARMSRSKFPSLQKVLMDSELPTLVVKMSTCDGESFVRATAIKCLQEMIQVEEIWNNALKTEDLPQKMRDILINETEGIVRVEAATFMCVAYEHQQFQKENLDPIYETMIYSSTTDLHWEVKIRALDFWDKVIKNHLQNQGMIDGSFPNVTFSKEHRKIVTLTDSEIRKRLFKILGQLSTIGCLGVLMSAIKDDCDMEVSKTAVKITQRLVDLFKKYNVRGNCSTPTSPLPTENGMSTTVSLSSGISVDENMDSPASNNPDFNEEVIEQIVNSKDVCLLRNVYTPSDYGSVSNYDIQVRKIVTPNEFLQFTQQDLNNIITEKKNWLNGIEDLGSLLDDMLKSYDDDVNNMDCY